MLIIGINRGQSTCTCSTPSHTETNSISSKFHNLTVTIKTHTHKSKVDTLFLSQIHILFYFTYFFGTSIEVFVFNSLSYRVIRCFYYSYKTNMLPFVYIPCCTNMEYRKQLWYLIFETIIQNKSVSQSVEWVHFMFYTLKSLR